MVHKFCNIYKSFVGKEPKIVNGPEVLNKYVGQTEENIRKLFEDAEKEYKQRGDKSDLHVIIFDEIDAICKQRGSRNVSRKYFFFLIDSFYIGWNWSWRLTCQSTIIKNRRS